MSLPYSPKPCDIMGHIMESEKGKTETAHSVLIWNVTESADSPHIGTTVGEKKTEKLKYIAK